MKKLQIIISLAIISSLIYSCGPSSARNAAEFNNPLDDLIEKWGQCEEVSATASDPYCIDSDGDGIPDMVEIEMGTDPDDGDMTSEEFCYNAMMTGSEYADQYCQAIGVGSFADLAETYAADGYNAEMLFQILEMSTGAIEAIIVALIERGKTADAQAATMPAGYCQLDGEISEALDEFLEALRTDTGRSTSSSNSGRSEPSTSTTQITSHTFYALDEDNHIVKTRGSPWEYFKWLTPDMYEQSDIIDSALEAPTFININYIGNGDYEYVLGTYGDTGYAYQYGEVLGPCGGSGCAIMFVPDSTTQNITLNYQAIGYTGCKESGDKDSLKKDTTGAVYKFALCYESISSDAVGENGTYTTDLSDDENCDYFFRLNPVDCNDKSDE
ncbi:MAG: hypothetical protein ABIA04_11890 [Pseudomonadota bacterium]